MMKRPQVPLRIQVGHFDRTVMFNGRPIRLMSKRDMTQLEIEQRKTDRIEFWSYMGICALFGIGALLYLLQQLARAIAP